MRVKGDGREEGKLKGREGKVKGGREREGEEGREGGICGVYRRS